MRKDGSTFWATIIIAALRDVPLSTVCLLPDVCLSEGRFLDGLGVEALAHRVITVPTTGRDLRTSLDLVRSAGLVHS